MRLVPPKGETTGEPFHLALRVERFFFFGPGRIPVRKPLARVMSTQKELAEKLSRDVELPRSTKIYVEGKQEGVRVPFREISQHQTRNFNGTVEENAPLR